MKKMWPVLTLLGLLSACNDLNFSGQIVATSDFLITEKYNQADCNLREDWWNCKDKTLKITKGTHSADISLSQLGSDKIIQLKLDGNNSKTIKMVGNKNVKLGDKFFIHAADIKQTFDISGTSETKVSKSEEVSAVETCSETHYEQQCHWSTMSTKALQIIASVPMPHGPDAPERPMPGPGDNRQPERPMPIGGGGDSGDSGSDSGGGQDNTPREICEDVAIVEYGNQDVSYHTETTVKTLTFQFLQSNNSLGSFISQKSSSQKVYSYQGVCRL
jgi:hypothetical protein